MTAPVFHDGVYHAANGTNEASGRSWHIPAPSKRGFYVWTAVQLVVCMVPVILLYALVS